MKASEPLELVGNSIGFAAICDAAKKDGFDAIIDGTGAEQMTGGNLRIASQWVSLALKAGLKDQVNKVGKRYNIDLEKHRNSAFQSMSEIISHDLKYSAFTKWKDHHRVTENACNIAVSYTHLTLPTTNSV